MTVENPFDRTQWKFDNSLSEESFDKLIQDSVSQVSVQSVQNRKKALKWGSLVILLLLALSFGAYLVLKPHPIETYANTQQQSEEGQSGTQSSADDDGSGISTTIYNPLKEEASHFPKVGAGTVLATLEGNTITLTGESKGSLLLSDKIKTQKSEVPCQVYETNELCLAGTGTMEDSSLEFFYLKDAVRGRMFDNAKNFENMFVKGSPLSASLTTGGSESSLKMLVIVLPDGSGFLVRYDGTITKEELVTLLEVTE